MSLICLDCGNTGEFFRDDTGQKEVEGRMKIDGATEDIVDEEITEEYDAEWNEYGDITCSECESSNIEESLSERDIKQRQWEHTDKGGKWDDDKIDEEDRNKDIGDELMVDDL